MKTTCLACGSQDFRSSDFLVAKRFPLRNCKNCGLSFVDFGDESASEDSFEEYWDEINCVIYRNKAVVDELRSKYRRYLSKLRNVRSRSLLDVGSGSGICVDTATQLGFDAMGVEPSEGGVKLSRETYGINVVKDLLRPDDDLPRNFGVLTLWDVIEHVLDPEELIRTCASHIEEHGYLVLETPNEGAVIRKLVRTLSRAIRWIDLRKNMYYRAHRYYFTVRAMHELLTRCGFDEIQSFKERSMHEKAKIKLALYSPHISPVVRLSRRVMFQITKVLPLSKNKMVVVARKAAASP